MVQLNSFSWKIKFLIVSFNKDAAIPDLLKMKPAMRILHMYVDFLKWLLFLSNPTEKLSSWKTIAVIELKGC